MVAAAALLAVCMVAYTVHVSPDSASPVSSGRLGAPMEELLQSGAHGGLDRKDVTVALAARQRAVALQNDADTMRKAGSNLKDTAQEELLDSESVGNRAQLLQADAAADRKLGLADQGSEAAALARVKRLLRRRKDALQQSKDDIDEAALQKREALRLQRRAHRERHRAERVKEGLSDLDDKVKQAHQNYIELNEVSVSDREHAAHTREQAQLDAATAVTAARGARANSHEQALATRTERKYSALSAKLDSLLEKRREILEQLREHKEGAKDNVEEAEHGVREIHSQLKEVKQEEKQNLEMAREGF